MAESEEPIFSKKSEKVKESSKADPESKASDASKDSKNTPFANLLDSEEKGDMTSKFFNLLSGNVPEDLQHQLETWSQQIPVEISEKLQGRIEKLGKKEKQKEKQEEKKEEEKEKQEEKQEEEQEEKGDSEGIRVSANDSEKDDSDESKESSKSDEEASSNVHEDFAKKFANLSSLLAKLKVSPPSEDSSSESNGIWAALIPLLVKVWENYSSVSPNCPGVARSSKPSRSDQSYCSSDDCCQSAEPMVQHIPSDRPTIRPTIRPITRPMSHSMSHPMVQSHPSTSPQEQTARLLHQGMDILDRWLNKSKHSDAHFVVEHRVKFVHE